MKYLLLALINLIYGVMLFLTVTRETPGFTLIIVIATLLSILGLSGLVLWIWDTVQANKSLSTSKTALSGWWQIVKGVDIVIVLGIVFRTFVLQPFMVEGNSMEPNYHDREYLLVDQISYRFREPKRGEVIIFHPPQDPSENYIKRIIGVPGDKIEIENGIIKVNNNKTQEPYLTPEDQVISKESLTYPYNRTLQTNEFFVLGDNRDHSSDSREFGAVPKGNIIGKAWLIVYPTQYFGMVKNPQVNI